MGTSTRNKPALPHLSYSGPYDKAVSIAEFYGFSVIRPPEITKEDIAYAEKLGGTNKELIPSVAERIALVRYYDENSWETLSPPVCVVYTRKNGNTRNLFINVLGMEKSMADMLIMHLSWVILHEYTRREFTFSLNTIGDKESSTQFTRELSNYYRKHINTLPDDCREEFKQDISKILEDPREGCEEFQHNAPRSMSFLTEKSRVHFKEILEYLESASIPYCIDESLLPPKDAFSETIFTITPTHPTKSKKSEMLAYGARSDTLTRGAGLRRTVPMTAASLYFHTTGRERIKAKDRPTQPTAYLIHLGDEARFKLFELLEVLRKAKIPVRVSFGKERMSEQIARAEQSKAKKTLIIGQKEALEHSVIVRDMETRSQEIVSINEIGHFLKQSA